MKEGSSFGRLCLLCIISLLSLIPISGWAQKVYTTEDIPNVQKEDHRHFVSDPEGHLSAEEVTKIDAALFELREKYTVEVVLVVVPSIENDDPEAFTEKLFRTWGIGKAEDDNGLMILYVYQKPHRLVRFETGYGLEGALPDATTAQITRNTIIPAIKRGNEGGAFMAAIGDIDRMLAEGYDARNDGNVDWTAQNTSDETIGSVIVIYLIISLIIGIIMSITIYTEYRTIKDPARRAEKILKFGSMALLIATIFLPAGLLISIIRMILSRKVKREKMKCPVCHTPNAVSLLSYPQNADFLVNRKDLVESQLHTINHYTLSCSNCSYHKNISVPNPTMSHKICPNCGGHTMRESSRYRISSSKMGLVYTCANCGHERTKIITTGSTGGFGGGTGGFGGGGSFGGGFGGGASGGGGSTVGF